MGRLDGKVCIVTGGARGQGAAEAELFRREGAEVVVTDVLDEGTALAASIGATFIRHDVRSEEEWAEVVRQTVDRHGRLDVLVNNAAVLHLQTLVATERRDFERVLQVNAVGPFLGTRACLPLLVDSGGGSIVNVGSVDSISGTPCTAAYTASKFALRGLTKVTALEHGKHGVRCNLVCPGGGNAEMVVEAFARTGHALGAAPAPGPPDRPIDRRGTAADFAMAVVYFASDESSFCSGTELVVDGGQHAGQFVDVASLWTRGG